MSDSASAKRSWIARVLGVRFGEEESPHLERDDVHGELNAVGIRLRDLHGHPNHSGLDALFAQAVDAFKHGDLARADRLTQEVADGIARIASEARAQTGALNEGDVSLKKAAEIALRWRAICRSADGEIVKLKQTILAELGQDESYDEDDLEEAEDRLEELDLIPRVFKEDLADEINRLINADPAQRAVVRDEIADMVDDQIAEIDGADLLKDLQQNGFHDFDLTSPAKKALADLRAVLVG